MIYDLLAPIYDEFNADINYSLWGDFIEETVRKYSSFKPSLVLDLGCGTGSMTIELASRGYDMTGVDYSVDMLNIARARAEKTGYSENILWLCQDMREFELYGTVDLAVCCLDGINHLTDRSGLDKCMSLVHNYLVPDGLFIFDINGKSKFENQYSDKSYVMESENAFCVWQNYYDAKKGMCDFYITLFSETEDGKYLRFDEIQREKMYTVRAVKSALAKAGFEFIGAFSDFVFSPASDESDRIYFVAKCVKNNT